MLKECGLSSNVLDRNKRHLGPCPRPGRTMKEGTLSNPKLGDLWKKPSRCATEPGTRSAKLPTAKVQLGRPRSVEGAQWAPAAGPLPATG